MPQALPRTLCCVPAVRDPPAEEGVDERPHDGVEDSQVANAALRAYQDGTEKVTRADSTPGLSSWR
jgi:hypothetical protein